ncbi:MAG TPA: AmmeMemoRadiSam system protein B [Thermoanaerobaculia bacterium]|nr:AmmeMemoRadiSam system protein B [Thermoanaerobaculia bacterium]
MPTIRRPAVAGMFYPGSPQELRSTVEELLRDAPAPGGPMPKAVIAPHAGYVYSGPTAAAAFQSLAGRPIERAIILGPAHRVPVRGLALSGADAFATPLGNVPVDTAAARQVSGLPQVTTFPEAHAHEHSLEVELPFLQVLFPEAWVLPVVVGDAEGEEVAEVLDLLWGGPETAVVISSDLSHYLPYDVARRVDRETADEILALEGPLHSRQACGAYPINGLLVAARARGMAPRLLDLRNSGDTAGDRGRVVGYGAFAFSEAG